MLYVPPKPAELAKLKANQNKTSSEMAELTGSTESRTWRKSTGGERTISAQTLFFLMARLDLAPKEIERVLNRMRKVGAHINLSVSGESET
ncbi:hypothetical protein EOS_02470 [Caballeronia mineralivorans PML1(12)]|uniref:XRE family transcriptional regulator n=1 Tax=Caballeronia mineralivorans PML1(12) TaxID=908627 RepID=A0A0J1G6B1_9BURK|nr:hypothetical protein EOS_02470 [Caballeronia mineralivorans PML1(12)]